MMTRFTVIKLIPESPLSLKGEERGALQEVLKIYLQRGDRIEELPIIPSTSLKGALRGIAEILGRSMRTDGDPRRKLMASHRREGNRIVHDVSQVDELLKHIGPEERKLLDRVRSNEERKSYIEYLSCPICRLFGSPGIASKVRVSDAIPVVRPAFHYITRTSIDRKTMKVKEDRLFTEEIVLGSEFRFVIVVDDLDYLEEELFNKLMAYLEEEGLQLGGGKSIGRGMMKVCIGQWESR
jgi:CRISPR-associated protein Csm3